MAHSNMERGDYYEAKAAILIAAKAAAEAEAVVQRSWAKANQTLARLGITPAPSYSWDDSTHTITPNTGGSA